MLNEKTISQKFENKEDPVKEITSEFNSDIDNFISRHKPFTFGETESMKRARDPKREPSFALFDPGNLYGVEESGKVYAFPTRKGFRKNDIFHGGINEVFGINQEEYMKAGSPYFKSPEVVKPAIFSKQGERFVLKEAGELDIDSSLKESYLPLKEEQQAEEIERKENSPVKIEVNREAKERQGEPKEAPAGVSNELWSEWLSFSQNEKGAMALPRFLTDKVEELTKKNSLTSEKQKELKDFGVFLREKGQ